MPAPRPERAPAVQSFRILDHSSHLFCSPSLYSPLRSPLGPAPRLENGPRRGSGNSISRLSLEGQTLSDLVGSRCDWVVSPLARLAERLTQLAFCHFQLLALRRRKVLAGAIDVEGQHRHRRAIGRRFSPAAVLGRALQRYCDLRRRAFEDLVFQSERIRFPGHAGRPFLRLRSSRGTPLGGRLFRWTTCTSCGHGCTSDDANPTASGAARSEQPQYSPLRKARSSRSASSADGSGHGSPRLRSVPVKFGGRFALKALRPSSPSVVVWINSELIRFCTCQAWSVGRSPNRTTNSFIIRTATGGIVTMCRAIFSARASNSPCGTTSLISPIRSASLASTGSSVSSIFIASM